jgi:hypothetical protein
MVDREDGCRILFVRIQLKVLRVVVYSLYTCWYGFTCERYVVHVACDVHVACGGRVLSRLVLSCLVLFRTGPGAPHHVVSRGSDPAYLSSVLFLNPDRSRHPPRLCCKALRFGSCAP